MDSQSETLIRWDCLFERMNKSKPTNTSSDKRIKTSMAGLEEVLDLSFSSIPYITRCLNNLLGLERVIMGNAVS